VISDNQPLQGDPNKFGPLEDGLQGRGEAESEQRQRAALVGERVREPVLGTEF
jgi:hypothetical protein